MHFKAGVSNSVQKHFLLYLHEHTDNNENTKGVPAKPLGLLDCLPFFLLVLQMPSRMSCGCGWLLGTPGPRAPE